MSEAPREGHSLPVGFRILDAAGDRVAEAAGLESLIAQVTARLRRLGAGVGDGVLYLGPQRASALVLCWASLRVGAVFTPIDEGWPAYLLARAAGGLNPRLVVTTPAAARAVGAVFAAAAVLVLEPAAGLGDLDALAEWAAEEGWVKEGWAKDDGAAPIDDAAPGACLFTSGSSGTPKGVLLTRAGLAHSARLTLDIFEWAPGERLVNLPDPCTMSGLRNALLAAPIGAMEWTPLSPGSRQTLFALLDELAQARCHRLVVGPQFLRQLVMLGDRAPAEMFANLKAIYCTGAPLDANTAQRLHDRWGAPVINYYGLTETGGLCLSQRPRDWRPGDQSLGWPAGCEARLVAEDGTVGAEGELRIRSPQLMRGYLGDAAATAARFDGEWLRTGDLARRRPDGAYELIGRAHQFINTLSTERVHPEEIERVLERHDLVGEAAVLGRPQDGGGERIVALVVARPGADPTDDLAGLLADFVAEHLGPARRPSLVHVVASLPRHGNGKLIRHGLADLIN